MKKSLLLKRTFISTLIFILFAIRGLGQLNFYESFDYSDPLFIGGNIGAAGSSSNNWITHSVTTGQTTTIDVISGNLSYTGLALPVGSKILLFGNNNLTSRDVNRSISGAGTTMYYSALINVVDNSQLSTTGDYFLHFGATSGTAVTVFGARLNAKIVNAGANYRLSICNTSGTGTNYTEFAQDLNFGTTYFVVVKYDISAIPTVSTLWVNPVSLGGSEPSTGFVTNSSSSSTFASISSVCLRNNATTPKVEIDEIRVGSTYADVTPAGVDNNPPVADFEPANTAIDVLVNTTPKITFDEPVRKTDGNSLENADLATLITLKKTDASGADVPFTATIDATKKVITVTPSSNLDNSQVYYLAVGPVEDESANESTLQSSTFTTIGLLTPKITVTYPNSGEVMYAGDSKTITWTSTNFDAGENVKVEVQTVDGSTHLPVWITLDPSAPNNGAYDVIVGTDAPYSTGYIIRLSGVTNGATDDSDNPFTVIPVAVSITDLRARCIPNDVVKLSSEATVTFVRTLNRHQKYIQDAGAGLLIDDNAGVLTTVLAEGDNIQGLEGKLGLYGGTLQIVPTMPTVSIASSGNSVTVPEMTIADYNTNYLNYESMLIKLTNVTFSGADGITTFAASTNYTVTDGVNNVTFRTFYAGEGNLIGSVIPDYHLNLTCIAGFFNTTIQVYSRTTSDFEFLTGVRPDSETKIEMYPVPANSELVLRNITNLRSIEILDGTGRVINTISGSFDNEIRIPVSDLKRGIYFIRFNTGTTRVIKKFIKS